MRKSATLITGANGEIGHGLISALREKGETNLVGLDLDPLDDEIEELVHESVVGSVLDGNLIQRINAEFEISTVYHLAAILSSRAEYSPMTAHDVNVGGMINMLHLALEQAESQGRPVRFFFPSSIAVYGIRDPQARRKAGGIKEDEFRDPETMYGCNKVYCECLGQYFSRFYKRLAADSPRMAIDFRAIRFPGLISAVTLPSGGTTDYGSEMIHAAVQRKPYSCFVRADTRLPFMTMPDAIRAILSLMEASRDSLTRSIYHVTAFNPSAAEIREKIISFFPDAQIDFSLNEKRQSIVDSWPEDIDDSEARKQWGWKPDHDFNRAFDHYLIPEIRKRYNVS